MRVDPKQEQSKNFVITISLFYQHNRFDIYWLVLFICPFSNNKLNPFEYPEIFSDFNYRNTRKLQIY